MKKKIALFLVAMLLGIGLIISCGGGGDDDEEGTKTDPNQPKPTGQIYSITFDANGGAFADGTTTKVVKTGTNGKVTFPDDPANGYDDPFFGRLEDAFVDWVDAQGATVLSTKVFTADATLKAKWNRWTEPAFGDKTVPLGYYTWINQPSQKGWYANGNDGEETDLEWDDVTFARYLVLETKSSDATKADFGGIQVVVSGNLVGGWTGIPATANLTYERGTDTVWIVFELRTFKDNYLKFVRGAAGKFLLAYYTPDVSGLDLREVYLTNKNLSTLVTTDNSTKIGTATVDYGFVTKVDLGFSAALVSPKTISFNTNGGGTNPGNIQVSSGKGMQLLYPAVSRNGYDFLGWFDGSPTTLSLDDQAVPNFNLETTIGTWGDLYGPKTPVTTDLTLKAGWKEQNWPDDPVPAAIAGHTKKWTVVMSNRPDLQGDGILVNSNSSGQIEIRDSTGAWENDFRKALLDPIITAQTASKKATLRLYIARPASSPAGSNYGVIQVKDGGWSGPLLTTLETPANMPTGTNEKFFVDYELPVLTGGTAETKVWNLILNPMNVSLFKLECWVQN